MNQLFRTYEQKKGFSNEYFNKTKTNFKKHFFGKMRWSACLPASGVWLQSLYHKSHQCLNFFLLTDSDYYQLTTIFASFYTHEYFLQICLTRLVNKGQSICICHCQTNYEQPIKKATKKASTSPFCLFRSYFFILFSIQFISNWYVDKNSNWICFESLNEVKCSTIVLIC